VFDPELIDRIEGLEESSRYGSSIGQTLIVGAPAAAIPACISYLISADRRPTNTIFVAARQHCLWR